MRTVRSNWQLTATGEVSVWITYDETSTNPPNRVESVRVQNTDDFMTARVIVHPSGDPITVAMQQDFGPNTDQTFSLRNNQNFDWEDFWCSITMVELLRAAKR